MPDQNWTLIDRQQGIYVDEWSLDGGQLGGSLQHCRIHKQTLRGGLSDGVDIVRVDNGRLAVAVLPTRGMGIWKAWYGSESIGWRSPVRGPVHPKFVPLTEPSGLGWLDGFDELLVRCGLESNGAPDFDAQGRLLYPLHGRIANKPAHQLAAAVDPASGTISLTGQVEETRFHFAKLRLTTTISTQAGSASLRVRDTVENLSASPQAIQLLYHWNFGDPLLDAGARVVAPVRELVPRDARAAEGVAAWDHYAAPQPGFAEQVYFLRLAAAGDGSTRALLKNAHGTRGVSLSFNVNQLPCFTIWKNTTALPDGYVTGLEPGTNFPNPRTFETAQNRVVRLGPGEQKAFEVELQYHADADDVARAETEIRRLADGLEPRIYDQPQAGWCAGV